MVNMENLGLHIKKKRGENGIRETASEIGISPATLSRIENGNLPDIETFKKICEWMTVDPGEVLGLSKSPDAHSTSESVSIHLKADKTLSKETANALAQMIIAAQKMFAM